MYAIHELPAKKYVWYLKRIRHTPYDDGHSQEIGTIRDVLYGSENAASALNSVRPSLAWEWQRNLVAEAAPEMLDLLQGFRWVNRPNLVAPYRNAVRALVERLS